MTQWVNDSKTPSAVTNPDGGCVLAGWPRLRPLLRRSRDRGWACNPDYLQIDNELSFRGSNRYPRSLGLVLRLALSLGITPIFIPPAEPWRNGIIEKFNHNMLKHFFSTQRFSTLNNMEQKAREFSDFHNQNHRYSSQGGKTPNMLVDKSNIYKLINRINIDKPIPLVEGKIIFIRFIRSDNVLKILNSKFYVNKQLSYTYVIAEIIVEKHVLIVSQDNNIHFN